MSGRSSRRRVIGGLVTAAMVGALGGVTVPVGISIAHETRTLTVFSTNVDEDTTPPGACAGMPLGPAGVCTLGAALQDAGQLMASGHDVIVRFAPAVWGQTFQPGTGPGTANPALYWNSVPAGRSLTIQGPGGGSPPPIFDGAGENRLFDFSGTGTVTIRNVVITNGRAASEAPAGADGAGIRSTASLVLENLTITGGNADGFGGAVSTSADLTVRKSTLSGNLGNAGGGSISITGGASDLRLENFAVIDTSSNGGGGGLGGGVSCECASVTVTSGSRIHSNDGRNGGGGIYARGAAVSVTDASIDTNTVFNGEGGAIYADTGSTVQITGSTINDNQTASGFGSGAGVYCECTGVDVAGSTLAGNQAGPLGGAIFVSGVGYVRVDQSTFTANTAAINGGAISCQCDETTVDRSSFDLNSAGFAGGTIWTSGDLSLDSSRILDSSASEGGGVWVAAADVFVTKSLIAGASAVGAFPQGRGGGLGCTSCGNVDIRHTTFQDGTAVEFGGGAWIDSAAAVTIDSSTFSGNAANSSGEALSLTNPAGTGTAALEHVTIADHAGEGDPVAALHVDPAAPMNVQFGDSIIADNDVNCSLPGEYSLNGAGAPNVIEGGGCDIVDSTVVTADPGLLPIGGQGGPFRAFDGEIPVHAITGSSVANDIGTCSGAPEHDNRGMNRPVSGGCDVGAVEIDIDVATDNPQQQIDSPGSIVPLSALSAAALTPPLGNGAADSQALTTAQVRGIDIESTPLRNVPLRNVGLTSIELSDDVLDAISLAQIPLDVPGGWPAYLAGAGLTQLAAQPLNTVTLLELLDATANLPAAQQLDLGQLDLSNTPLGSLSVGSIALGGATLVDLAGTGTIDWCGLHIEPYTDTPCNDTPGVIDPNAIDTETATLVSLSLEGIPLRNVPLRNVPLRNVELEGVPLRNVPLRNVDLSVSPLRNVPLRNVPATDSAGTVYDVATIVAAPLRNVPLRNVDLSVSPLRNVPLRNVPLRNVGDIDASPLRNVPLRNVPLRNVDIDASPLRNVPLRNVPLRNVGNIEASPLRNVPLRNVPLRNVPLRNVGGLEASPLRNVPLRNVDLVSSPLRNVPLGDIDTIAQLVDCNSVDCASLTITLADVTLLPGATLGILADGLPDDADLGVLGDIVFGSDSPFILGDIADAFEFSDPSLFTLEALAQVFADDTTGTYTLADIAAAIELEPFASQSVADLLFDALTLDDLLSILLIDPVAYGIDPVDAATLRTRLENLPIGELFAALAALEPPVTVADLFLGLFAPEDYPWEELDLDAAAAGLTKATFPDGVPFGVVVTSTLPTTLVDLTVTLPAGFTYVSGSLVLPTGTASAGEPAVVRQPDGTTKVVARLSMPELDPAGPGVRIQISALPPFAVGETEAITAQVDAPQWQVASTTTDGYTIEDALEVNDTPEAATDIGTPADTLVVSYLRPADVDWFGFSVTQGQELSLILSNLPDDYDMLLFGPTADTMLRGAPTRSLVPAADNGLSLLGEDTVVAQISGDVDTAPPAGYRLVEGSARRGTGNERIDTAPLAAGRYLVKISGYNGAGAGRPYVLRTRVDGVSVGQQCPAVATPIGAALPLTGITTTIAADTDTLVLVDTARLQRSYPGSPTAGSAAGVLAELAQFTSALDDPANDGRFAGTKAAVVDLASVSSVRAANAALDAQPCDPVRSNAVVAAIGDHLDTILTPSITNLVIVGADDQIPMARLSDNTPAHNEQDYAETWTETSPVAAAQALGYVLSDDPYGTADPIAIGPRELFVPDLAVGRLVESPNDIVTALDNFVSFDGLLDPQTALSTGYDFLEDGARAVAGELQNTVVPAGAVDQSLISTGLDAWTKAQLDTAFTEAGPDVASVNAHFDHYRALPADQDAAGRLTDPLTVTDVTAAPDVGGARPLERSIVFSMGCHGGLSVSDISVGTLDADWAQAFGSQGSALFAGNTGYGYGDTEVVAFSEELMRLFAARLSQAPTVGAAMTAAKQRYVSDLAVISPFEEKVSSQVVFYGLPMYRIDGATPPALDPFETVVADPISGLPSTTVTLTPNAAAEPTSPSGTYYSVNGEVQATAYQPVQPRIGTDVTVQGATARGALITSLTSRDVANVDPVVATPTDDVTGTNTEAPSTGTVFPSLLQTVSRVTDVGGDRDRLVVVAGQFRGYADDPAGRGDQRLFTGVGARVFYAPAGNTDTTAPRIVSTDAAILGGQAVVEVEVGDTDVARVLAMYIESDTPDPKVWKTLELTTAGGGRWIGTAPTNGGAEAVDYFVQALDTGGNVSVSSDKGTNFRAITAPDVPPVAGAPALSITPDTPESGAVFTGTVTVTALPSTPDQQVQLLINGVLSADNPATVAAAGLYTVSAVAAGFAPVEQTFAIDPSPPTLSAAVTPAANAAGWHGAGSTPVTVRVSQASGPIPVATVTWSWLRTPDNATNGATVSGSSADVPLTADGVYTVSFSGTTAGGRSSNTGTVTVQTDATAPSLTVVAPAQVTSTQQFVVSCAATDTLSGIAESDCADRPQNAALLPLGPNLFTFTATDVAGNTSTRTVTVTVAAANTAPVVRADMRVAGVETIGFQTGAVLVTGSFADTEGNGPYTAAARWSAGSPFVAIVVTTGTNFAAPWLYSGTAARTVTVRICDAAGACGTDDITVRPNVTTKVVPLIQCVTDRGPNPAGRYEARWGYRNAAAFAIAVPSIPLLENTFTASPFWRGQPEILLAGTRNDAFRTTFDRGTQTWRLNGTSVTARTNTTRC